MKIISESKACTLKGNQQVFYLQNNQIASCCRAYSETLETTRSIQSYVDQWKYESQQLTDGVELDSCRHCWHDEHQKKLSHRQQASTTGIHEIELFLSNLCNHMCSYCSPKYSSLWSESIQSYGTFQNISLTAKNNLVETHQAADISHWLEQIQKYIHTCDDNSVMLKLLGGEPLMQHRNLEKLLSFNSKKIKKLLIHTNLNPPTNKFLVWILNNIEINKLKVVISIDASPLYNHVPRAGFNQTNFLSNLELLQNNKINFEFISVSSVLSIFDLENFISWLYTNNFKTQFTNLNNPDCLNPQYIPLEFRQKIWNTVGHLDLDPSIAHMLQQDTGTVDLKLFEQYNYLTQYFDRNNMDPTQINNKIFVEYWTWLTKKFKNENSPSQ